ncbi:MAG TPA: hypothetical protein VK950_00035 [Methylophilus sp.]|nr:hypothetical protein [Methylophilus sp.]
MNIEKSGNGKLGLARLLVLGFVFIWFFIGGIAHFLFTELEIKIVPPWLPEHRFLVLVSGAFELIGAIGILFPRTTYCWLGTDSFNDYSDACQYFHVEKP